MKKEKESVGDADSYNHVIPSLGKKSAVTVLNSNTYEIIDADKLQAEKSEIKPRVCEDVMFA